MCTIQDINSKRETALTFPFSEEQSMHPTWMFPCFSPGIIWTLSKLLARITRSQPDAYAYENKTIKKCTAGSANGNRLTTDLIKRTQN